MNWFAKLFSSPVVDAVEGVANAINQYVETPDEKRAAEIILAKMAQQPGLAQVELNKIEAAHRSLFIAGWRPAIGWLCAVGLAFPFVVNPILQWATDKVGPALPTDALLELVIAMLGLAGLRTAEKFGGKAK